MMRRFLATLVLSYVVARSVVGTMTNCTVPAMVTACTGLELTLANCSLVSTLSISQPINASCSDIAITLGNVSFALASPGGSAVSFTNSAAFRNISVIVHDSFIRGNIVEWTPLLSIADVSLWIENTTVEEGRGMMIFSASSYSGRITMTARNVSWTYSSATIPPLLFCIKSNDSIASSDTVVTVTFDRLTVVIGQVAVAGGSAELIGIESTYFRGVTEVAITNSVFHWNVSAASHSDGSGIANLIHSTIVHLRAGELGLVNILVINVSSTVVHVTTLSDSVSHEASFLTLHSTLTATTQSTFGELTMPTVLLRNLSLVLGNCTGRLEGNSRTAVFAATNLRTLFGVAVIISLRDSNLTLATEGNVPTLTLDEIQRGRVPRNVALSRQSAIVNMALTEYVDVVSIAFVNCAFALTAVLDSNAPFNNVFDDSFLSSEVHGVVVSNVSNALIHITDTAFSGGVFRRSRHEPYVTIGCFHMASVVSLVGCPARSINVILTNVDVFFVDNVSYTPPNPIVAAQFAGLGSIAISLTVLTLSTGCSYGTITISNTTSLFDITNVGYFTEQQRGGAATAMVMASPMPYYPSRRGRISELLHDALQSRGLALSVIAWTNVDIYLCLTTFTFAPLDRVADAEQIATVAATTGAVVFAVSGGLLTGGLTVDGLQLTIANSTLRFNCPAMAPPHVAPLAFAAQLWQHSSGHVVAHVSAINITAVSEGAVVAPLFVFANASFSESKVSLSSSTLSASLLNAVLSVAVLVDAANATIRDSKWMVSSTRFTTRSGGVLFGSGAWGVNATVGLGCGTTWNGGPIPPRAINVPKAVAHRSEAAWLQAPALSCPRAPVLYSVTTTIGATTATHRIATLRSAAQAATIAVASLTVALLPSAATVVPGLQMMSQLCTARQRCAATTDDGGSEPPPLSDTVSNPLGIAIRSLGEELMFAGGSVVSWFALGLAYALTAFGAVVLQSPTEWVTRLRASPSVFVALRLPGSLYAPAMLVLQPLMTAAVVLLASPSRSAGSVVFGAAILFASLAPLSVMMREHIVKSGSVEWREAIRKKYATRRKFVSLLVVLQSDRAVCLPRDKASRKYLDRYGGVVSSFVGGKLWFVAVEVSSAVLSGVLSGVVTAGVGPSPTMAACSAIVNGVVWFQFAVFVVLCVAVVGLCPYNSYVGNLYSAVASLLSAVSLALVSLAPDSSDGAVTGLALLQATMCALSLPVGCFSRCAQVTVVTNLFSSTRNVATRSLDEGFAMTATPQDNLKVLVCEICKKVGHQMLPCQSGQSICLLQQASRVKQEVFDLPREGKR